MESSRRFRSSAWVISARTPCSRELITTRAPSVSSNAAVADPSPPAPPASKISKHASEDFSGGMLPLLGGYIPECDHREKQHQHFAVAQVVLQQTFGQNRQNDGDGAMQHEAGIGGSYTPPQRCSEIQ